MSIEDGTKEPCLSIDEFNKPLILNKRDAIYTLLVHLILLEPGTYSNRPGMGVGIVSRYRYNDEASLEDLKKDIEAQIDTYLPEFDLVNVNVYMDRHNSEKNKYNEIVIEINVDGVLYKYETSQLSDNKVSLNDFTS